MPFRHHATGRTVQIGGDWSIGVLRSNRRLSAGVSHIAASPPHTFQHWQGLADPVGRQPVLAAYGLWFPTGHSMAMLFAAQMLLVTEGGFTWRQSDYRKWLGEAGFASVDIVPTPSTLVFAT